MNCWRVKNLLSAFLDNELDGSTTKAVREHLADCPACAREAEHLSFLKSALADLQHQPPPDLARRVMNRAFNPVSERVQTFGLRRSWAYALAAVAFAVVVVGALVWGFAPPGAGDSAELDEIPLLSTFGAESSADLALDDKKTLKTPLQYLEAELTPQPNEYLANHLANSEPSTPTSQDLSRHVIADEALNREATQVISSEAGVTFSMVSASAAGRPGSETAALPALPTEAESAEAAGALSEAAADETGN